MKGEMTMFNRSGKFLVITTNNLRAMEATTEWIYEMLKVTYFIQIELFPNMTLYRICVSMRSDWDKKTKKKLTKYLAGRNLELMKES